jgi:hypothetical protein
MLLLFGHLAQFLNIPMDFPQKQYMMDHCDNVVRYIDSSLKEKFGWVGIKEMVWQSKY